jgi:hydroxymethylpyrimidine pyrophosphatase-like HAD family hydrolase
MAQDERKTIVLDWDSTTADESKFVDQNGLPDKMVDALWQLQQAGHRIIFNTTRDPIEMMDVIGHKLDDFEVTQMHMALENGGRVGKFVNTDDGIKFADEHAFPLSDEEITALIAALRKDDTASVKQK